VRVPLFDFRVERKKRKREEPSPDLSLEYQGEG
jgi:hypothetical protein